MKWRVIEDAYRTVGGQPPQCTADEFMAVIEECKKGDLQSKVLLLAARRAEAYDALAAYDREPNELNLTIAADAMATAAMSRVEGELARQTVMRLLGAFPPREAPQALLGLLIASAASARHLGETLGQALDRVCREEQALGWALDVALDR